MATVYRGTDAFLRRQVALKVLLSQFVGDGEFVGRFRREARAAASLSHPNIVAVYDVGQDGDDCHFIVQEFVDGRTLKERIAEEGPLPVREALEITEQVLRALGQAHAAGIVHRDVKPQNVLLTRDGRVKVTDFGIAQAEAGATAHSGAIVGTAHYAAPEQVRGRPTDERCDLYSTGVMLYEMLTGQVPYDGEGPFAVALQHVEEPVPDPAALRPDLPPGVSAVVRHAMRKSPDERYSSTTEFMTDVDALLEGRQPVYAEPQVQEVAAVEEPDHEAPRRPRRRIWTLVVALGVVLIMGAGVSAAVVGIHRLMQVPTVKVPSLLGADPLTAQQNLLSDGLVPLVESEPSSKWPAGSVAATNPPPGSLLRRGQQVVLYVSSGAGTVTVPDLVGLDPSSAVQELQQGDGLQAKIAQQPIFSDKVAQGEVASSDPAAGTKVSPNTVITLQISAGPSAADALPDYVGQTQTAVSADLASRQLQVGSVTTARSGWPSGIVTGTEPVAGAPVLPGQTVNLQVSSGCIYQQTEQFVAGPTSPPAAGQSSTSSSSTSSSSGTSSSTSSSSGTSSSTSSSGATSSSQGVSPQLLQETVLISDMGQTSARVLFNQQVPSGQAFRVTLCWSSPQGATWTWQENGVTRGSGLVDATTAGGADAATTGTSTTVTTSSTSSSSGSAKP